MTPSTTDHPAYTSEATPRDGVFALAPPDDEPLDGPTRFEIAWDGQSWVADLAASAERAPALECEAQA